MKAKEKVVEILIESGIDHIFGVPGGSMLKIYDALYDKRDKINAVLAVHEQSASCMADMYGRLTGRPGVFIAQGAFAGSLGLFGVMEGFMASSPMLVLTEFHEFGVFGLHGPFACGTGEYGSFDLRNILRATTKYTAVATTPTEAVQGTQFAIKHAVSGRPGPTACIMSLHAVSGEFDEEVYPKVYPTTSYLRTTVPQVSEQDVQKAADLLLKAKKPVIIAGNGVHVSKAYDELQRAAELLGAPVATTYLGKSTIAENHPLAIGVTGPTGHVIAQKKVNEADVLVVIGSRLNPWDTVYEFRELINPAKQKIIQIDIDPRNAGWTFPVAIGLVGDAKSILCQLIEETSRRTKKKGRIDIDSFQKKLAQEKEDQHYFEDQFIHSDVDPILPARLVKVFRDATDKTAIITADAGKNRHWMLHYFQTMLPRTYFGTGGIGGVSWSVPAIFVAKLLHPDRQCVAVCSDGGFAMQIHILLTALQYDVAAVFVIMNNSGLGMVRDSQGERQISCDFIPTDYAAIARAFGCLGLRVERNSDLRPALDEALRSERAAVVDVVIDREERLNKIYSPLGREAQKSVGFQM